MHLPFFQNEPQRLNREFSNKLRHNICMRCQTYAHTVKNARPCRIAVKARWQYIGTMPLRGERWNASCHVKEGKFGSRDFARSDERSEIQAYSPDVMQNCPMMAPLYPFRDLA